MPGKRTLRAAKEDKREGKSPSTQAGEFVREEIHHVREGKHGARSTKQAIAIGLSKARRASVDLPPPAKGKASEASRHGAARALKRQGKAVSRTRSRATSLALKREPHSAASRSALSQQAKSVARQRGASARAAAAKKAVRTKGSANLSRAARQAAQTRARHG